MRLRIRFLFLCGLAVMFLVSEQSVIVEPLANNTRHPVYQDKTLNYVFDQSALPQIRIELTTAEWNQLLKNFDANPKNEIEVKADFLFNKNGVVDRLNDIGFRVSGNTSRRRPEGKMGQLHQTKNPDWKHAHFAFRFGKFVKNQKFRGLSSLNSKWAKDDPSYVREMYSHDLFKRFNVWTAPFSSYARLTIKIKENNKAAYFGIYQMIEPINDEYLQKRFPGQDKGFLWKNTNVNGPADLSKTGLSSKMGIENPDQNIFKSYDLKTGKKSYPVAAKEFTEFVNQLNSPAATQSWLSKRIDTNLFLKAMAVNVGLGNWDDYWIAANNYYLYFAPKGKVYFIPYDFDNTLGTSYAMNDTGNQNPFQWGANKNRPLVNKILAVSSYRNLYKGYLRTLIDPKQNLLDAQKSKTRIQAWQKMIAPHVKNDTGEDMVILDQPAPYSNQKQYRLLGSGQSNFFVVKKQAIEKATK
jgi:spore coat protein H